MSAVEQLDIFEAARQRDVAFDQVVEHSDDTYRNKLWATIQALAAGGETFCADDARLMAGDPPAACSTNLVGALFNHAAKAGLIRTVGFTRSARVVGHSNTVRMWRGVTG